jgi:branched-chain amino acid transport system permease protein
LFGHRSIEAIPSPLSLRGLSIGSVQLGYRQLLIIGTFIFVILLLELFFGKTWLGQAMRGTAEDREAASLRGINPLSISRTAFIMAGLVAAIAGFVIAPITFSDPTVGFSFTLKGFLALAVGGFGSLRRLREFELRNSRGAGLGVGGIDTPAGRIVPIHRGENGLRSPCSCVARVRVVSPPS